VSWPDLAILGVLGWFIVTSMAAGLLREALGLLGLIVGIVAAGRYHMDSPSNGTVRRFGDVLGAVPRFLRSSWPYPLRRMCWRRCSSGSSACSS
jgi:hypothetical protein